MRSPTGMCEFASPFPLRAWPVASPFPLRAWPVLSACYGGATCVSDGGSRPKAEAPSRSGATPTSHAGRLEGSTRGSQDRRARCGLHAAPVGPGSTSRYTYKRSALDTLSLCGSERRGWDSNPRSDRLVSVVSGPVAPASLPSRRSCQHLSPGLRHALSLCGVGHYADERNVALCLAGCDRVEHQ